MAGNLYWEEIERYFVKKRGSALILSPKDWPIVTSWQERGIPLEVIFAGIDQAFARLEEKQQPSQRQPIRTLAYCQYDVEELWHARKDAISDTAPLSEKDVRQKMMAECRKLAAKISSTSAQLRRYTEDPHYQGIHDALISAAETLDSFIPLIEQGENDTVMTQLTQNIRELEKRLLAQLEQALDDDVRRELYAQAEAKLAAYKKNMKAEVYQETLRIAFLQALRAAYPLPFFL
jgi:hypothetical protein